MAGRHSTPLGYCDQIDLENYLLTTIDPSFDSQIDDWIATAEAHVNRYTGYTTASGILAEQITGEKTKCLITPEADLMVFPRKSPIISVSSLHLVRGTTDLTLSLTTEGGTPRYDIPAQDNYIHYPAEELTMNGVSTINNFAQLRGTSFYAKIDYIGGYQTVPDPIRMATVNLVSDMIMRHANKEGLEQITQGRVTKRWRQRDDGKSDFVRDAEMLMNQYRISANWLI